jgi:hypothetical protein
MPQRQSSSGTLIFLVVLIIAIFAIAGAALATNGFSSSTKSATPATPPSAVTTPTPGTTTPQTPTPTPPPSTPDLPAAQGTPATAVELIKAFSEDSIAAIATYGGRTLAISGTVSDVITSPPPLIYMKDPPSGMAEVQFGFSQGQEGNVSQFNKGDSIKIEGTITGFQSNMITVYNCKFVK